MEPKFLPETLDGERVVLKRRSIEHGEEFYALIEKNRTFLDYWMDWVDEVKSVDTVHAMSEHMIKNWDDKKSFTYVVLKKNSGEIIGNIGTGSFEWDCDSTKIGYWLSEDEMGNGYMTEATKLLEDALFEMGINRIGIDCNPNNKKSCAIPIRLSYMLEGTLRQFRVHHGEYQDALLYSKLREEWLDRYNGE
jgi:ribosomal-protein-serine acetyltransferase